MTFAGVWSVQSTVRVDINGFSNGSGSPKSGEKGEMGGAGGRATIAVIFLDPSAGLGDEKRFFAGFRCFLIIFLREMGWSSSFYQWYIIFRQKFIWKIKTKSFNLLLFSFYFLWFFLSWGFQTIFFFIVSWVCCCMNCVNGVATVCAICILYSIERMYKYCIWMKFTLCNAYFLFFSVLKFNLTVLTLSNLTYNA